MSATGMDALETDRFLHACELCGLLETVDTITATMPAAPATAAPAPNPNANLPSQP